MNGYLRNLERGFRRIANAGLALVCAAAGPTACAASPETAGAGFVAADTLQPGMDLDAFAESDASDAGAADATADGQSRLAGDAVQAGTDSATTDLGSPPAADAWNDAGALDSAATDAAGPADTADSTAGNGKDSAGDSSSDAPSDTPGDTGGPPADPGACKKPGAEACGKVIGGAPSILYVCTAKLQWKPLQTCQQPCQLMPEGVPDRCPEDLEVPGSLVTALSAKPYVEQSCKPTSYKGWPYAAQKCTYSMGGLTTTVTTATPAPEVVAAWIVDSAAFMPAVWALRYRDAAAYKKALKLVAAAVLAQSSRIFPLEGGIIEQMSGMASASVFDFYHGITQNCTTGCYCRINSLQKQGWCSYQQFLGAQTYNTCMTALGATGLTPAWAQQCLGNHIDAWKSTVNQHFRAKAHQYQQSIKGDCANSLACTPDEVVAALQGALQ